MKSFRSEFETQLKDRNILTSERKSREIRNGNELNFFLQLHLGYKELKSY